MALTLADQYYLKALDDYDYNFEAVIENLNYALSYDDEHCGANHLMGKLYMEHFQKFDLAKECFELAMASDPQNINTCESFTWLLIRTQKFEQALKLIRYAYTLTGVNISEFMRLQALVFESSKDFEKALKLLNSAIHESCNSRYIFFLESEVSRVEKKSRASRHESYHFTD